MSSFIEDQAEISKKRKREKGFRLNAQQIFLTYPQCCLSPKQIIEYLEKLDKLDLDKYVVAQEKHKDGNLHIHAYLLLKKKINIRDEKYFDIRGCHPNVQGCRSWKKVICYVTKDGNYVTNLEQSELDKIIEENTTQKDLYVRARKLARTGSVNDALEVFEHPKLARDMTIHGAQIERNLRNLAVVEETLEYEIKDFDIDFEWDRKKSLVLWGPTNTCKTSLAKALLGKPLVVRHKDQLKKYASGKYTGIVFDDMCFDKWEREWIIAIVDCYDTTALDVKHGYVELPKGTPRIFTSNRAPENHLMASDPAIARRLQIVNIQKPCMRIPEEHSDHSNDEREGWDSVLAEIEEEEALGAGHALA